MIWKDHAQVNCTGGSWFESKHFSTEEELVEHLDQEYSDRCAYLSLRKCEVKKDYESITGFYAKKGAKGHIIGVDGGHCVVFFDEDSLHLIKSNYSTKDTLTIPSIYLHIGEREDVTI